MKKKTIKLQSLEVDLESPIAYDYVAGILAELVLIKLYSKGNGKEVSQEIKKERSKDEKGSDIR